MEFIFKWLDSGLTGLLVRAILISLLGIFLLIAFIVIRRWYRARHFRRLDDRMFILRASWDNLLNGRIPAETWRMNRLDSEIMESMLLDRIEVAHPGELPALLHCLRSSGLLDLRIYEARHSRGWKRRAALVALGRTRCSEAVPALVEALGDRAAQTRIAAVRGLGRIALAEAALPLLDRFSSGRLRVPEQSVMNALVSCCRNSPQVLMEYVHHAVGNTRVLLVRVLAEVASPELGEELLTLVADELAEVRASAARALGHVEDPFALWALGRLVKDPEYSVRLRAVVALGSLKGMGRVRFLIQALCDANRFVRQRAAWALARMEPELEQILQEVVDTHDRYALQAFVSELERSGAVEKVTWALQSHSDRTVAYSALLQALNSARDQVESARASKSKAAAAGAGK